MTDREWRARFASALRAMGLPRELADDYRRVPFKARADELLEAGRSPLEAAGIERRRRYAEQ